LECAWQAAIELDRRQYWLALSHKAMEMLNVELALRVYSQLGDAGMVMALQDCQHIEDRHLLAGHISLLFGDYQRAQELFLASSRPVVALNMRRDLLQWEQALQLAHSLAPPQVPSICVQYGQQMEFREEYEQGLKLFEAALNERDDSGKSLCPADLAISATMGVARCNLRLGNVRQGIRLATELQDKQLYADSGEILEQQKLYSEAAAMYINGELYEKAADMYTRYITLTLTQTLTLTLYKASY
jgi:WD repeat-containing protein 19